MDSVGARSSGARWGDLRSVVVGVVTALLVALVAVALVVLLAPTRPWTASTSLVVLPDPRLSPAEAASYYDKLGPELVSTFAQVVSDSAGGSTVPGSAGVSVTPMPNATIIVVTARSSDPRAAVGTADSAAAGGVATLSRLGTPYLTRVLSPAAASVQRAPGPGIALIALIAVGTGLVAGLAAQQASWALWRRQRRRRPKRWGGPDDVSETPAPSPAAPTPSPSASPISAPTQPSIPRPSPLPPTPVAPAPMAPAPAASSVRSAPSPVPRFAGRVSNRTTAPDAPAKRRLVSAIVRSAGGRGGNAPSGDAVSGNAAPDNGLDAPTVQAASQAPPEKESATATQPAPTAKPVPGAKPAPGAKPGPPGKPGSGKSGPAGKPGPANKSGKSGSATKPAPASTSGSGTKPAPTTTDDSAAPGGGGSSSA